MKMTATLRLPKIDLSGYRRALDTHMTKVIVEATQAWLQAVVGIIPVWSGASLATFTKLASQVQFQIEINPVAIDRVSTGISASEGRIETKGDKYVFHYKTTLPWLIWNEYNNANTNPDPTLFYRVKKEGPYNFQIDGYEAFRRYADTVKLPSVKPFVITRTRKI